MSEEKKIVQLPEKRLKVLQCVCKQNVFTLIGDPIIKTGGVKLIQMVCVNPRCQAAVNIAEDGTVGQAKNTHGSYTVDDEGKKHYTLKAETGELSSSLH